MSTMQDYLDAEATFEAARRAHDALPREQQKVTPSGANNRLVMAAALAFAADAADRHRIEEAGRVYLVLGEEGWTIDRPYDTWPLEGYEGGPINEGCGPELEAGVKHNQDECDALRKAASWISLPNPRELLDLLTATFAVTA